MVTQGGLGIGKAYHDAFPSNTVISGVTYLPTSQIDPGIVSHTRTQRLHLGMYPSDAMTEFGLPVMNKMAGMMTAAGGHVAIHSDVQAERWKRLIGNAEWNPICALSRCRDLEFLDLTPRNAQEFIVACKQEVVAVAGALGHGGVIREDAVEAWMQRS